jgi:hypothetical protein
MDRDRLPITGTGIPADYIPIMGDGPVFILHLYGPLPALVQANDIVSHPEPGTVLE